LLCQQNKHVWLFKRHEGPDLPPNGLESNYTNEKHLAKSCLNVALLFLLEKKRSELPRFIFASLGDVIKLY